MRTVNRFLTFSLKVSSDLRVFQLAQIKTSGYSCDINRTLITTRTWSLLISTSLRLRTSNSNARLYALELITRWSILFMVMPSGKFQAYLWWPWTFCFRCYCFCVFLCKSIVLILTYFYILIYKSLILLIL